MFRKNLSAGFSAALLLWIILSAATAFAANQDDENSANRAPRPMNAIDTVLSAFDRVPIVALGEAHSLQTEHYFIQDLIRHPGSAVKTSDIVIEFASARYQSVIDC